MINSVPVPSPPLSISSIATYLNSSGFLLNLETMFAYSEEVG